MSTTVSVHEAKTHLSRLINDVLAGKEVTVARRGEPVVKIVPVEPEPMPTRRLGWLSHTLPAGVSDPLAHGFWDPLPDEYLGLGDDKFADVLDDEVAS
ncbi:MAG: type II toxin-antitoxin system prevent-host-death family antitoxin [Pseudomonadota bacterium]